MAEVNDKGEVTVEGEFAGRLEGFRFRQDATATPDEARTLRAAAYEALKPEFARRADRFYNAPDTEFDLTEQGGLMWGTDAVGKILRGPDAMRPQAEAFVDEEAGTDVGDKVRRRLQHFIDRRITTLFEPLMALGRDEALTGLARGFAFQLVEAMGIMPRDQVAEDVKALDQDARASLRKHGVRFGQFTIFVPALLKPAPTRLRLVLWSLWQGLDEFPESPPPGLVTIPHMPAIPAAHYLLGGYRPAGARAIRIDMLERLADLLRAKDSRAGFEATADMLSITGLTLEQFADLMEGLGYRAERAERAKQRPAAEAAPESGPAPETAPEPVSEAMPEASATEAAEAGAAPEPVTPETAGSENDAATETQAAASDPAPPAEAEVEAFYTFTWAPRPRNRRPRDRQQDQAGERGTDRGGERNGARHGRPRGNRSNAGQDGGAEAQAAARPSGPAASGRDAAPMGGNRPARDGHAGQQPGKHGKSGKHGGRKPDGANRHDAPRQHQAGPSRKDSVDPDNPFAVLASLRDRI